MTRQAPHRQAPHRQTPPRPAGGGSPSGDGGPSVPVQPDAPLARALRLLPAGWRVRRTWPAGGSPSTGPHPSGAHPPGVLAVEAIDGGRMVGALVDGDRVRVLDGADPRLPGLAPAAATATIVGHRPGKRAVLRLPDGRGYLKVLRPGRAVPVADGLRIAAEHTRGSAIRVPEVLAVDDLAGVVHLATVPGQTLHQLLGAGSARAVHLAGQAADALEVLAAADPTGLAHHDGDAEAAVLTRWAAAAHAWSGPVAVDLRTPAAAIGAALRGLPPVVPVVAHRDLHDKQILDGCSGIGLLDLDTLCLGHPDLDRANLLAHLTLRALQGRCDRGLADACAALLRPCRGHTLRLHTAAALLRLAAVYTFRPGPPGLPRDLRTAALDVAVSD